MHILGQEAVVSKEEAFMAVGNSSWCSCRNRFSCWNRCSCYDYCYTCLGRKEASC
uniref:Uncharacterized protein n=1 Tax=Megaselia scalaris TaxID=36166 RepID=T1GTA5_MEGSC